MKKLLFFGMLILLYLVSSVCAEEYYMNVGDSITFDGKKITLTNVGSTDSIVVDVDGVFCIISTGNTETCNGIEVTNDEAFYISIAKEQNSAKLDISKEGQVCYEDNICEFKDLGYLRTGDNIIFRGKTIEIIENDGEKIILNVDGIIETLLSAHKARLEKKPFESMIVINGVGFRLLEDTTNLLIGENYGNCENDCNLDVQGEYNYKGFIDGLCSNEKRDKLIGETDEDCGGNYCDSCNYSDKCKVNRDCSNDNYCFKEEKVCCAKIEIVECSLYLVDNDVDKYGCELSPTCCGDGFCEGLENEVACPSDCKVKEVEQEEIVENKVEELAQEETSEEKLIQEEVVPKTYNIYSDYDNKKCVVYVGENESLEYYDICEDNCEKVLLNCNKKFEKDFFKNVFGWFTNLLS